MQPAHWTPYHQRVRTLTIHPPDLDLPVISSRHNKRHARVEGSPVDPAVMTLDTAGKAIDTKDYELLGSQVWQSKSLQPITTSVQYLNYSVF